MQCLHGGWAIARNMKRKNREEEDVVDDEPCSKKQRCHSSSPFRDRYVHPGAEELLQKSLKNFVHARFNTNQCDNDKCMDLETFAIIYRERIENSDKSLAGLRLDLMNTGRMMIQAVQSVFGDCSVKEYENEKRVELKIHYKFHDWNIYSNLYNNIQELEESGLRNDMNGKSPIFGSLSQTQSSSFDETTPVSNKFYKYNHNNDDNNHNNNNNNNNNDNDNNNSNTNISNINTESVNSINTSNNSNEKSKSSDDNKDDKIDDVNTSDSDSDSESAKWSSRKNNESKTSNEIETGNSNLGTTPQNTTTVDSEATKQDCQEFELKITGDGPHIPYFLGGNDIDNDDDSSGDGSLSNDNLSDENEEQDIDIETHTTGHDDKLTQRYDTPPPPPRSIPSLDIRTVSTQCFTQFDVENDAQDQNDNVDSTDDNTEDNKVR